MNATEALGLLADVKTQLGRNYKSAIRDAWVDGDYQSRGLGDWDSQLQQIRNQFGPSWLVKAQPRETTKYAHLTVDVRLVGHGAQVDIYDRTLSTPDGQGIQHECGCFDFADDQPITERARGMRNAIVKALRLQA